MNFSVNSDMSRFNTFLFSKQIKKCPVRLARKIFDWFSLKQKLGVSGSAAFTENKGNTLRHTKM